MAPLQSTARFYVYLVAEEPHEGEVGHWTKIGYTKNPPEWRVNANLKRGNPRRLTVPVAFQYPTEYLARRAEQDAHRHFKEVSMGKEWFRIAWQDVAVWFRSMGAVARTEEDIVEDKERDA